MIGPIARQLETAEKSGLHYPVLKGPYKPFHFLIGRVGSDNRKIALLSSAAAIGAFYAYFLASLVCYGLTQYGYGPFTGEQAAITVLSLSVVLSLIAPYYTREFPPLQDKDYDFLYAVLNLAPAAVLAILAVQVTPDVAPDHQAAFLLARVGFPSLLVLFLTFFMTRAHFYLKRRSTWER